MKTERISCISPIDEPIVLPFDLQGLRVLHLIVFALLCLSPIAALSSSSSNSQAVVVHIKGQHGSSSTQLQSISPGSTRIAVGGSSAPATGQSVQPAISSGGISGGDTYVVNFDEITEIVGFAWWDLTTCQSSAMIPYLYTPPAYGTVSYSIGSGTVTSSPCTGVVVPITLIYYTRTTHTNSTLFDAFDVHANSPAPYYDQFNWIANTELFAKTNGKCHGDSGGATCGEPISIGTGNVFESVVDYETAGQNKLSYIRYYNSTPVPNTFASSLGRQWRSNYDRYLYFPNGDSSVVVAERDDGQKINFYANGSSWSSDSDVDDTLSQSGTTWILKDHDDTVETYAQVGSQLFAAVLQSVALRNGYTQTLSYNSNYQLLSVTDSYNRQLAFSYLNSGVVSNVITPDGTTLSYGYNSLYSLNDQLASVSFSTSPVSSQQYVYQNPSFPFALTGIEDENGNMYESWTYDTGGRALSNQVGGVANLVTVNYNQDGSSTVTNALGVADTYTFSISQDVPKLSQISRAATATTAAATETFTYDSNGYLASQTDWNGNQTTYVNNSHGDPTTINEAVGSSVARTTTIAYDPTFVHLPSTITTPGVTTSFTYDGNGNVLTKKLTDTTTQSVPYSTNGTTKTWTYTWNNSLVASIQSPRTDVVEKTSFTYDSTGATTAITNPLSQRTTISSHTGGGLPLTMVDPNGVITTLVYDARQHLLSSTTAGRVMSYGYDAAENLTSVTQADGSGLAYTYDSAHRLTAITDLFGQKISYTLDALGDSTATNVLNVSSTMTSQHSNSFDALGRMLQDIGASTQTSSFTYDAVGNMITASDPLNNTTQRVFDALNRLHQITDPASGITTTSYDAHDRPLNVTAPAGGTTAYVYDGFGNLIQESSPNTGTAVYYYDKAGNRTKRVASTGVVTTYSYDALDRVVTMSFPSDSAENVSYTYDQSGHGYGIGRLTSVSDAGGTISRTYDQFGNLLTDVRSLPKTKGNGTILATTYAYDQANRIISITYPSGATVNYSRDGMGRITAVTAKPNGGSSTSVVSGIAYQPFGAYTALTFGNSVVEARGFDQDYRLTGITDTASSNIQELTYAYYPTNNVQTITDGVNSGSSQSFNYDNLQRLSQAQGGYGSFSFTYDKDGNRVIQILGPETTVYGYGAGTDLLKTITVGGTLAQTIGYTADGRISSLTPGYQTPGGQLITSIGYNNDGRLATLNPGRKTVLASYTYDGFGQRFAKTISSTYGRIYQYGQDGMLLEETDASGVAQVDYIYLDGRPISTLNPATGTLYYLHDDMLGTPQVATDSSQNIAWQASYEPFGAASVSGTITQNLRLPGQYFDLESGANHNGFRNYVPDIGRYAEPDPFAMLGTAQLYDPISGRLRNDDSVGFGEGGDFYVYVGNDPADLTDPNGLRIVFVCRQRLRAAGGLAGLFWHHTYIKVTEDDGTPIATYGILGPPPKGKHPQTPWDNDPRNNGKDCKKANNRGCGDYEDKVDKLLQALDKSVADASCPSCGPNYKAWIATDLLDLFDGYNSNTYTYNMVFGAGLQPPPEGSSPGYHLAPGAWYP